ncbi:hypothetical protein MXMO3_01819 [Maritalea myrionectae]|uniref:Uncharacterized protein n=1 Tax=Maritalea myrionectae TaxID=454601 RepID=A0A2R4MEK1_9HYPH|nr:hypothetical protein [Maritalea myrionectae]AVX04344.1 hypothetical protein MXMO3_01819 [Maritalea myrionectae]
MTVIQHGRDSFEDTIDKAFGYQIQTDDEFCTRLWSSLTNIEWLSGEKIVSYSFREAGGLIAGIREDGSYIDWYCSGPAASVDDHIAETLKQHGWRWQHVKTDGPVVTVDDFEALVQKEGVMSALRGIGAIQIKTC